MERRKRNEGSAEMLLSSSFHLRKYDFLQTLVILTPGVVILLLDGELIRACGYSNTSTVDFTPIIGKDNWFLYRFRYFFRILFAFAPAPPTFRIPVLIFGRFFSMANSFPSYYFQWRMNECILLSNGKWSGISVCEFERDKCFPKHLWFFSVKVAQEDVKTHQKI